MSVFDGLTKLTDIKATIKFTFDNPAHATAGVAIRPRNSTMEDKILLYNQIHSRAPVKSSTYLDTATGFSITWNINDLSPKTGYWIDMGGAIPAGFYTYGVSLYNTTVDPSTNSASFASSINKFGGGYQTNSNMTISERGFVYVQSDTNATPLITNGTHTKAIIEAIGYDQYFCDVTKPGQHNGSVSGLTPNKTYYVRSYAIWNLPGSTSSTTEYGPVTSFTTDADSDNNNNNDTSNDTGTDTGTSELPSVSVFYHEIINSSNNKQYTQDANGITINGFAYDTAGMNRVDVYMDSAFKMSITAFSGAIVYQGTLYPNSGYTYNIPANVVSGLSNGNHTVLFAANSKAIGRQNVIERSVIISIQNLAAPSTKILTATGGLDKVTLKWDAYASTESISSIIVEKYNSSSYTWVKAGTLNSVTAIEWVDTDVTAGTTYTYRLRAKNATAETLSNEASATPYTKKVPSVTTVGIDDNLTTYSSITAIGNVTNENYSAVTTRGICYSATNPTPSISDSIKTATINNNYSCLLNNLNRNTKYYVRAYATNGVGTGYGEVNSTTTLTQLPTVSCQAIELLPHGFTLLGKVTDDGANKVLSTGFYYSGAPDPVNTGYKADTAMLTTYEFGKKYTGMIPDKLYYAVSFVKTTNDFTAYSDVVTFRTPPFPKLTTPLAPVAIDRTDNSMRWVCHTVGARLVIAGYDGTFTSPTDLIHLTPNTQYSCYSYIPGDGVWTDDSLPSATIVAATRKPIPIKPEVSEIEQDYIRWITPTAGAKIVCDGKTKTTGEKWFNLTPNTLYEAYSYQVGTAGWDNDSFPSEIVKVTTPKLKYGRPGAIVIEMVTCRTAKLSAPAGVPAGEVIITTSGISKPSGSIWTWLDPETNYPVLAEVLPDDTHRRSDYVTAQFTTLKAPLTEPDLYVIGFMEDGARAPIKLLNNMTIISDKPDMVDIIGKKVLVTKPGPVKITVEIEGVTTECDITVV